ncbi:MAG: cache domain-containing protein, partial [Leptolyngbyaceae cyanobacterium bins.59]|nr:cache domain-containing protein [Leptolyngbyaceae cyanobacterium bins.59]
MRISLLTRLPSIASIPLRWVLIVPFVLQTVGVVALVEYLSYRSGHQAVLNLADRLMDKTSDRVEQELKNYLQTPLLINRLNVDAVQQGHLDLQNITALESLLFQRLRQFDQVSAVLFASPEGVFRGVERYPAWNLIVANPDRPDITSIYPLNSQGKPQKRIRTLSGVDVRRDRPWYKRAVQTGKLGWSPIFQHGPYQTLALNASQPVYEPTTQRLLGVFSVHLRLDYLSKFLQSLEMSRSGQIIILEENEALIATSTLEPI